MYTSDEIFHDPKRSMPCSPTTDLETIALTIPTHHLTMNRLIGSGSGRGMLCSVARGLHHELKLVLRCCNTTTLWCIDTFNDQLSNLCWQSFPRERKWRWMDWYPTPPAIIIPQLTLSLMLPTLDRTSQFPQKFSSPLFGPSTTMLQMFDSPTQQTKHNFLHVLILDLQLYSPRDAWYFPQTP